MRLPLIRLAENALPSIRPCRILRLFASARNAPAALSSRRTAAVSVIQDSRLFLHHLIGAPAAEELAQTQRTLARLLGGHCLAVCASGRRCNVLWIGFAVAARASTARAQSGFRFRFGCRIGGRCRRWFGGYFSSVRFRRLSTATTTAAQFHARQTQQTEAWRTAPGATGWLWLFGTALRRVCVAVLQPGER